MATHVPVKLALYATAFPRDAPLNVEPLKSDSLVSAAVKFALLHHTFRLIKYTSMQSLTETNSLINCIKALDDYSAQFEVAHIINDTLKCLNNSRISFSVG